MTAFDHQPDAACPCAVCGYHRGLPPNAQPVNDTTGAVLGEELEADEAVVAVARLRGGKFPGSTHTIPGNRRLSREEKRSASLLVYPDAERPQTRGDCLDGPRPCPWVSCRWHLYLDVSPVGSIKLNHPDKEPWELEETCALDVADRGGVTLDVVGRLVGITRERVRQIEAKAARRMGRNAELRAEAA